MIITALNLLSTKEIMVVLETGVKRCVRWGRRILIVLALVLAFLPACADVGLPIMIDSGVGDQFGDLYAIVQAARTPGLSLVGVTTAFHSTQAGARTVQKLLGLVDRQDVPVSYGDVSGGGSNFWLQWGEGYESVNPPKPSAQDLLIEASKKYPGELMVIATGPLTNLAAALQKDPETAKRLKRIYIPDLDCSGQASPNLVVDPESAQAVFGTTIPITVFPSDLCKDLVLTRGRILRIASCRSTLTDSLLNLTCQYRGQLTVDEPILTLPSCLAVAYANAPSFTNTESKRYQLVDGTLHETGDVSGREIQVAVSTHPAALMRELASRLGDSNLDFGTTFAHFVMGLNQLSPEALVKVQEGLKAGIPVPEVSQGTMGSEVFRIQALAYLGGYIDLLKGIDDPVAVKMCDRFQKTILRVGKIGWWFPDNFYEKWCYEGTPGKPVVFNFGISNEGARELTGVHGSVTSGDQYESVSVASSTKEVRFAITMDAVRLPSVWPVNVELKAEFTCQGVHYTQATTVPLRPIAAAQVTAVRGATDSLSVRILSSVTATLSAQSMGTGSKVPLEKTILPGADPAWTTLPVQDRNRTKAEALRISLKGVNGAVSRVAILPATGEIFLAEPEGPSKSACLAVSKGGRWAWSTDYLSGADVLEYRVLANPTVPSSTDPLYAEVEYFCEGDDLDTFRIEGATESAVYQPLTAFMTKPEERGWRIDRFRVSPQGEAMIRTQSLRWLRVNSGQDGDEVIGSIRFR